MILTRAGVNTFSFFTFFGIKNNSNIPNLIIIYLHAFYGVLWGLLKTPLKTKESIPEGKDKESSETNGKSDENGHGDKKEVENEVEGKANEAEPKVENEEKSSDKEREAKNPEKAEETKDNDETKNETAVNEITPASDQNGDQVRTAFDGDQTI